LGLYHLLEGRARFKRRFVEMLNRPLHAHSAK
jgi:hypothetical protein